MTAFPLLKGVMGKRLLTGTLSECLVKKETSTIVISDFIPEVAACPVIEKRGLAFKGK